MCPSKDALPAGPHRLAMDAKLFTALIRRQRARSLSQSAAQLHGKRARISARTLGLANGEEWWQPTYELFVADNWDELSKQLTPEVTAKLHDKAQPLPVEHLDI